MSGYALWLALATTALGFGGLFASFTYLAPMMTQVALFAPASVTWLLVLFGGGLVAGNIHHQRRTRLHLPQLGRRHPRSHRTRRRAARRRPMLLLFAL